MKKGCILKKASSIDNGDEAAPPVIEITSDKPGNPLVKFSIGKYLKYLITPLITLMTLSLYRSKVQAEADRETKQASQKRFWSSVQ